MRADTAYWEVGIEGHPFDLDHLARHFKEPPVVVENRADADGYVLRLDEFTACKDDKEVLDLARRRLVRLNGVMKHERGRANPVQAGAVYKRNPNGGKDVFKHVHDALTVRVDVTTLVTDSDGRPVPPSVVPSRAVRLSVLCESDVAVDKFVRLLTAPDAAAWVGLYRRYEVIETDVGGQGALESRAWCAPGDIGRFKHSANSVTVAGDDARHGTETKSPPARPMLLDEASALVRQLTDTWLAAKGI